MVKSVDGLYYRQGCPEFLFLEDWSSEWTWKKQEVLSFDKPIQHYQIFKKVIYLDTCC